MEPHDKTLVAAWTQIDTLHAQNGARGLIFSALPSRLVQKGNPLGASNYLWVRRAMAEEEETRDAIVDLAVTSGTAKDRTSDIHTPPAR